MKFKNYVFGIACLLSIMFFSQEAKASHITGGDIQYKYIGDSTGIARQYKITLRLYRDCSPGTATISSESVSIKSSCYPTQTLTSSPLPGSGLTPPTYQDCVPTGSVKCLQIYTFDYIAILPGNCADYVFYYSNCCRPTGVTNLAGNSSIYGFYFEATLNNTFGQNSSPRFISEPARAFCVGNNFNWTQSVTEANGDSLEYVLVSARENNPPSNIPYAAGHTIPQPMITSPPGTLLLDAKTGTLNFTTGTTQFVVIPIIVNEYRLDTIYNIWVKVGSANREMNAAVAGVCSPQAMAGVYLDLNAPGVIIDPATGLPTVEYTCLDSAVLLNFAVKLDCSTISPDGTDFRLTAPDGQPIPVKELVAICDVNNETKQILVKLHKPLAFNGYYYLYSKIGNDSTTLANKCGFPMNEFDTIQLYVQGCFQTEMDIKNVSVIDDEYPRVQWLLDTIGTALAPFPKNLVDEYKVLRKDPGAANYNVIYTIADYKSMVFNDKTLGGADVDLNSYEYKVEVVVNGSSAVVTREIASILLKSNPQPIPDPTNIDLHWNEYIGWPAPEYTMHLGTKDQNGIWVDVPHVPPTNPSPAQANPTNDTVYNMRNTNLAQGDYRICVLANFPGGSGPYQAWSNCIPFTVTVPPVIVEPTDTPIVPNVFSPNGDGNNDFFTIENIMTWSTTRSVRIFNRWGNIVYDNEKYDNNSAWDGKDKNGSKLADGVYFYMIDLYDQPTGQRWTGQGQVTIFGSN